MRKLARTDEPAMTTVDRQIPNPASSQPIDGEIMKAVASRVTERSAVLLSQAVDMDDSAQGTANVNTRFFFPIRKAANKRRYAHSQACHLQSLLYDHTPLAARPLWRARVHGPHPRIEVLHLFK
ncbi:hypothetical protein B0H63DRAFT_180817 [Podospora didyma]|uniref:Uncharacterized protein n=1 Tax=Podospora didyma TaxID=330526 RepID=A0AAE0NPS4_9PEZI|nr:hypothetical protein B0H63DRAFT_180817 [Podospora didyma]